MDRCHFICVRESVFSVVMMHFHNVWCVCKFQPLCYSCNQWTWWNKHDKQRPKRVFRNSNESLAIPITIPVKCYFIFEWLRSFTSAYISHLSTRKTQHLVNRCNTIFSTVNFALKILMTGEENASVCVFFSLDTLDYYIICEPITHLQSFLTLLRYWDTIVLRHYLQISTGNYHQLCHAGANLCQLLEIIGQKLVIDKFVVSMFVKYRAVTWPSPHRE